QYLGSWVASQMFLSVIFDCCMGGGKWVKTKGECQIYSESNTDNTQKNWTSGPPPWALQLRSLRNALKSVHCAPAVMLILQEALHLEDERYVKLTSGLPGGIGLLRAECGCLTCPIMILGQQDDMDVADGQIPKVISLGQHYVHHFRERYGDIECKEIVKIDITDKDVIKKEGIKILGCFRVMSTSPGLFMDVVENYDDGSNPMIDGDTENAYLQLLSAFQDTDFHCAHSVLLELSDVIEIDEKLLRTTEGFIGGTVLQGKTCGALTAGVLAIGELFGQIENNYLKAVRLIRQSFVDGDIMRDDLNSYNRAIIISREVTRQFEEEFGTTACSELVKTDFSRTKDVEAYIAENGIERCRQIAGYVAHTVQNVVNTHRLR
ncbi:MAG: C-GCAxxG-C-C family protein, partial [bacterium]